MSGVSTATIITAMMTVKRYLAFTGNSVIFPDHDAPQPSTIVSDLETGKIAAVLSGNRAALGAEFDVLGVEWIEVDDKLFILPGLVECVPALKKTKAPILTVTYNPSQRTCPSQ